MVKIIVNTQQAYPIYIESGLLQGSLLIETCAQLAREWVVITDNTVKSLYAESLHQNLIQHFNVHLLSVPAGEENKTRDVKAKIEDQMLALGCGRDVGVIALGGGMITDLAGFVAATYCRGVPAIYIPTTLLAMVDATVGGKTGVNTPQGKNLIGTITQPRAVFVDPTVLKTLDKKILVDGIIESIKHALIADAEFFEFINSQVEKILQLESSAIQELITRSIDIKRKIIEEDEFERGKRVLCNFGHTIGHALETYFNYSISHGVSVAIGMIVESHLSTSLTGLSQDDFNKIKNCLLNYNVPLNLNRDSVNTEVLKALLQNDKKTRNQMPHFVLLSAIGKAVIGATGYTKAIESTLIEEGLGVVF